MSIASNYVPIRQLGNGSTTQFSSNWAVLNSSYIQVFLENAVTNVQTPQVLGADFTLQFDDSGFTVTFLVAPTSANYVVIGRNVTADQTDPYKTSKGFQGATLEDSLDKLTAICQDLIEISNRSFRFQLGSAAVGTLPQPVDGAALVWNGTGGSIANGPTVGDISNAAANAAVATAAASQAVAAAASVTYKTGTVGGTGDAVTLNTGTGLSSLTAGMRFRFIPTAANTLTNPTLAVDSVSAVTLYKTDDTALVALQAGDLASGLPAEVYVKDSTHIVLENPVTPLFPSQTGAFDKRAASVKMAAMLNTGFVNEFDNAGMNLQRIRGTSGTLTAGSPVYIIDRWIAGSSGANMPWSVGATGGMTEIIFTGNTGMTDSFLKQRIEAERSRKYVNQNVCVSWLIVNNTTISITPQLFANYANSSDNFSAVTSILSPTNMQTIPAGQTKWVSYVFNAGANAANGLEVGISFGNALTSGSYQVGINTPELRLTNIATGLNDTPPVFVEIRPRSMEEMICNRYWETSYDNGIAPGTSGQMSVGDPQMVAINTQDLYIFQYGNMFRTRKRVSPTVTAYNPNTGTAGTFHGYTDSSDTATISTHANKSLFGFSCASNNLTSGRVYGCHWTADANL